MVAMPTRRIRVSRAGGRRTQRRKLVWATVDSTGIAVTAGGTVLVNALAPFITGGASVLGCTVMRTHLYAFPDTAEPGAWTFGMIVGRGSDTGTELDPLTHPELDWMLLTQRNGTYSGATPDAITAFEFDLRSKRKMEEQGQRYTLVFHNGGVASRNMRYFCRTLIALP